jgi:hypothetical protein
MLNQKQQESNDWCDHCSGDIACRIPGWPVMNVSAVCDSSPNSSLFSGENGCCSNGTGPIDLATWVETLCNGSYQHQFADFGGMDQRDWWEWELPWNWTVQAENTSSVIVPQPTCPATPLYFGLFFIENGVLLVFYVIFAALKLLWIKGKLAKNPSVMEMSKYFKPLNRLKKRIAKLFTGNSESTEAGAVIETVVTACIMCGLQLGFNFASAYIIRATPGYEHVPAPLLALLFCARPRLGWVICLLARLPNPILEDVFHLRTHMEVVAGKATISRVAISSAISEIVMQCLGSYSLGRTAHVGVTRGFYLVGHLWPYWRGRNARIMYLGALFWLISFFGILVIWGLVAYWHVEIFVYFQRSRRFLKRSYSRVRDRTTRRGQRRGTLSEHLDANDEPKEGDNMLPEEQPMRRHPNQGRYYGDETPEGFQNMRWRHGDGHGSTSDYESQLMRGNNFRVRTQGGRPLPQRGPYQQVPLDPEADQIIRGNASGPATALGRPSGLGYGGYERVPLESEPDQIMPGDLLRPIDAATSEASNISHSPGTSSTLVDPHGEHANAPARPTVVGSSPLSSVSNAPTAHHHQGSSRLAHAGSGAIADDQTLIDDDHEQHPAPFNPHEHEPEHRKWQGYILALGVLIGFVSYIAQWLFWAGFVNTSGPRYVVFSAPLPRLMELQVLPAKIGTYWHALVNRYRSRYLRLEELLIMDSANV